MLGLTNALAIAAGDGHTCALRDDGTVSCWGGNSAGQLGDGTTTFRATPDSVIGLTNVVAIAAGNQHSCALRADGTVRCWGRNDVGQLGDGTRTNRLTSVAVSGLTTAVTVAAGLSHTCALRVDGAPVCWEFNNSGQIGNGTTTDRLAQMEVPSFRANVDPTADLASNGHRVLLTAVVNCPVDHKVTIEVAAFQGAVVGQGRATGKCRGGLTAYPVQISVRQGAPFLPGPAQAEITATVREGHKVVDVQVWSRVVEIDDAPQQRSDNDGRRVVGRAEVYKNDELIGAALDDQLAVLLGDRLDTVHTGQVDVSPSDCRET